MSVTYSFRLDIVMARSYLLRRFVVRERRLRLRTVDLHASWKELTCPTPKRRKRTLTSNDCLSKEMNLKTRLMLILLLMATATGSFAAPSRSTRNARVAKQVRVISSPAISVEATTGIAATTTSQSHRITSDFCDASECGSLPEQESSLSQWGLNQAPECKAIPRRNEQQCLDRCNCYWSYNVKKCARRIACLDVAFSEKNACETQCMIDFA